MTPSEVAHANPRCRLAWLLRIAAWLSILVVLDQLNRWRPPMWLWLSSTFLGTDRSSGLVLAATMIPGWPLLRAAVSSLREGRFPSRRTPVPIEMQVAHGLRARVRALLVLGVVVLPLVGLVIGSYFINRLDRAIDELRAELLLRQEEIGRRMQCTDTPPEPALYTRRYSCAPAAVEPDRPGG